MTLKSQDDLVLERKEKEIISTPARYKAIMLNDDFTPFEFVVIVLMQVFNKTEAQSWEIAAAVHENGRGLIQVYSSREIAEAKVMKANSLSQQAQLPLKCITEKE